MDRESGTSRTRKYHLVEPHEPDSQSPKRPRLAEKSSRPRREIPGLRKRIDLSKRAEHTNRPGSFALAQTIESDCTNAAVRRNRQFFQNLGVDQCLLTRPVQRRCNVGDEELTELPVKCLGSFKHLKRRRSIENGNVISDIKRPKLNNEGEPAQRSSRSKSDYIKSWLSGSSWSRRISTDETEPGGPQQDDMALPSPGKSGVSARTSSSRKSEKSYASVHDTDYRHSLSYRNIYIECEDPPAELMWRAKKIVTGSRSSPEIDDTTAQVLKKKSRELQTKAEDLLTQQLAPRVIPAMVEVPDQRLAVNSDQPWLNSVPLSLKPSILTNELPLPRPKPDVAFGYSEAAFDESQIGTTRLLIDTIGRSYVVPDKELYFPFLHIELKSQAKGGTHYIAVNQTAGAGAVASNGLVELTQRASGLGSLDYDEPNYFSLSMDHTSVYLYVHWLGVAENGQLRFNTEGLSKHFLDNADGLRAVNCAVKNILDWGLNERLPAICRELDAYRKSVEGQSAAKTVSRQRRGRGLMQNSNLKHQPGDPQAEKEVAATENSKHAPKENLQKGNQRRNARTTTRRMNSMQSSSQQHGISVVGEERAQEVPGRLRDGVQKPAALRRKRSMQISSPQPPHTRSVSKMFSTN